jgi:hypothetical protein
LVVVDHLMLGMVYIAGGNATRALRFASELVSGALVGVLPDNPPSPTALSALTEQTVGYRLDSECSSTGSLGIFRD